MLKTRLLAAQGQLSEKQAELVTTAKTRELESVQWKEHQEKLATLELAKRTAEDRLRIERNRGMLLDRDKERILAALEVCKNIGTSMFPHADSKRRLLLRNPRPRQLAQLPPKKSSPS
jgi:hypothetical protein